LGERRKFICCERSLNLHSEKGGTGNGFGVRAKVETKNYGKRIYFIRGDGTT